MLTGGTGIVTSFGSQGQSDRRTLTATSSGTLQILKSCTTRERIRARCSYGASSLTTKAKICLPSAHLKVPVLDTSLHVLKGWFKPARPSTFSLGAAPACGLE